MQQWEYLLVRADWFTGGMRALNVLGRKSVPLDEFLAAIGDDGWEVVAMQHVPNISESGKLLILLKRPKAQYPPIATIPQPASASRGITS